MVGGGEESEVGGREAGWKVKSKLECKWKKRAKHLSRRFDVEIGSVAL